MGQAWCRDRERDQSTSMDAVANKGALSGSPQANSSQVRGVRESGAGRSEEWRGRTRRCMCGWPWAAGERGEEGLHSL